MEELERIEKAKTEWQKKMSNATKRLAHSIAIEATTENPDRFVLGDALVAHKGICR